MTAVENRLRVARETAIPTPRIDPALRAACRRGHLLDFENTRIRPNGSRTCKTCERESERRRGKRR
jgi:hypothetical protein